MTTRASVIVALWLLLTGGIGDAVLRGGHSPAALLVFQGAVTALAVVALWLQFKDDPVIPEGSTRSPPRRRDLHHYD